MTKNPETILWSEEIPLADKYMGYLKTNHAHINVVYCLSIQLLACLTLFLNNIAKLKSRHGGRITSPFLSYTKSPFTYFVSDIKLS